MPVASSILTIFGDGWQEFIDPIDVFKEIEHSKQNKMKISEALEKAGYGEDLEKRAEEGPEKEFDHDRIAVSQTRAGQEEEHSANIRSVQKSISGKWDERLFKAVNDSSYVPEIFKTLRSRILHPLNGEAIPKTILITSAIPREGKSFVAANLGISLAHGLDQHSLLVDCDLRKPAMAKMFGLDNSPGLVDYLRDGVALSKLIQKTPIAALSVLTSGIPPENPAELLGSSKMSALVEELSSRYDDRIIIFDSPPMLVAAESSVLAGQVDAMVLVVRQSTSGKAQIQKLIDIVGTERILGIVFNDQKINLLQKRIIKGYASNHGAYYD